MLLSNIYSQCMIRRRPRYVSRLLLFALVLWAQSVAAVHAVDHQWHDSTELCQVIKSAEQAKFFLTPVSTVLPAAAQLAPTMLQANAFVPPRRRLRTTRAPPASLFIF